MRECIDNIVLRSALKNAGTDAIKEMLSIVLIIENSGTLTRYLLQLSMYIFITFYTLKVHICI